MERVVVVGPPGSGKSTLGKRLADVLGCPHVELDGLWWGPDWEAAGNDVFRERLAALAGGDRWVADGNYVSTGAADVLWPVADTVVWLDHPRRVTMPRVIRRTLSRAVRRTELWNGNREPIRRLLSGDSIIRYAWQSHPKYGARYEGLDTDPDLAHLTWVRLRRPRDVRRWLRSSGCRRTPAAGLSRGSDPRPGRCTWRW